MKYNITDVYSKFRKINHCPICGRNLERVDYDRKCPDRSTTVCGVVHTFISRDRVTVSTMKYKIGMAIRFSKDIVTIFKHPAISSKDEMIFGYDSGFVQSLIENLDPNNLDIVFNKVENLLYLE
jgi:hypothetical protein